LETVRLGAKNDSSLRSVEEYMRNIRVASQNPIQIAATGITGCREILANVVHQFVSFVVKPLLGNRQRLTELALESGFDATIAVDMFQMRRAEDYENRRRQHYGELHDKYQPGSLVPEPFCLHRSLLIRASPESHSRSARQQTYLTETGQVSNRGKKT